MIFVEKGTYAVGYLYLGQYVFAKLMKQRTVIGDWQIINDKKSEFWFRAKQHIEGYCLKLDDVKEMQEEYEELMEIL